MSGRWTFWTLAGLAFGLLLVGLAVPLDDVQPIRETYRVKIDPQVLTEAERAAHPDCVENDQWPSGQIPDSALVRDHEAGPVRATTFDEAFAAAESGAAWFVGSCQLAP